MKRIFIIFFMLIGGFLLYSTLPSLSFLPFATSGKAADVTTKIDSIHMELTSIKTTIIPEEREDVKTDLKGKGKVEVTKRGDTITIKYKRKPFDWFSSFEQSELLIYIPEDYHRDMKISLGSCDVILSPKKPFHLNNFTLNVGSGDVQLQNVLMNQFKGNIASGDVTMKSITTDVGKFDVSSGEVNVHQYKGRLDANVSSGAFFVQMDELVDAIDVDVSSGEATIDLPDNADFTLRGNVSSGDITNHFPLDDSKQEKRTIEGTHGSGKHSIKVDVSSGDLQLQ
ncbi:DUF4097 domain-containing protein [Bacillus sp. CGMCC 1.16541]|uniref:LiaG family protein n=1 Tax=Bacillus sp. CGMCC 1.16541 TaxID=2185143 RepID=UPI000D729B14|nr:DUF4097 domain-containing protein [Bacillus sp. CGMCC 1.16541]